MIRSLPLSISLFVSGCVSIPPLGELLVPASSRTTVPIETTVVVDESPRPCLIDQHGWRIRNLSIPYDQQQTDC